jgi:hypothetical protein
MAAPNAYPHQSDHESGARGTLAFMRKRLITPTPERVRPHGEGWLDLERAAGATADPGGYHRFDGLSLNYGPLSDANFARTQQLSS